MQLHIILLNGTILKMDIDDKFKLSDWLAILRRDGYIATVGVYIAVHAVMAAVIINPSATSEVTLAMSMPEGKPN